jgi:hypothetical protein
MMITTRAYDGRLHRITYPLRASKTNELGSRADIDALLATTSLIEQHRAGSRSIVASCDDYVGDHREYVLEPFAYRNPTRFSDGTFGVLYASESRETSIREAAYWAAVAYSDSNNTPIQAQRRQYLTLRLVADSIVDIRKSICLDVDPLVYHASDYAISRQLGWELREMCPGLIYDSVRHSAGTNVGAFVPRIISGVRLEYEMDLVWDGSQFNEFKQITPI